MRIRGFSYYFSLLASSEDARSSTDPVTQLWDLFSFGIPLCYIFDQLPIEGGFAKINNSHFNQDEYDANPDKLKKRAIALFAMQIRTDRVMHNIPGCELFTVTDLWDRNLTDGLVKVRLLLIVALLASFHHSQVINTVTAIVKHLPPDAFDVSPPSPTTIPSHDSLDSISGEPTAVPPANAQESARNNIIREMVETERKYVQDLEVMQVRPPYIYFSHMRSSFRAEIFKRALTSEHH
jgi:cell division control protein 24